MKSIVLTADGQLLVHTYNQSLTPLKFFNQNTVGW